jgi:hypothetical protein
MTTMAEATEFDMYATRPPDGVWNYVVDGYGVVYHRPLIPARLRVSVWPFSRAGAEYKADGVRLSPDCEYRSWRNEYVLVQPDQDIPHPHMATAKLSLWTGSQGRGGNVVPVTVNLNLQAGAFDIERMPDDAPPELRAQADIKGSRLISYLAAECERRNNSDSTGPVTSGDLERRRADGRAEMIRAYCAEHDLTYERIRQPFGEIFVIDGERLDSVAVAVRYLPQLFSTGSRPSRLRDSANLLEEPRRSGLTAKRRQVCRTPRLPTHPGQSLDSAVGICHLLPVADTHIFHNLCALMQMQQVTGCRWGRVVLSMSADDSDPRGGSCLGEPSAQEVRLIQRGGSRNFRERLPHPRRRPANRNIPLQ